MAPPSRAGRRLPGVSATPLEEVMLQRRMAASAGSAIEMDPLATHTLPPESVATRMSKTASVTEARRRRLRQRSTRTLRPLTTHPRMPSGASGGEEGLEGRWEAPPHPSVVQELEARCNALAGQIERLEAELVRQKLAEAKAEASATARAGQLAEEDEEAPEGRGEGRTGGGVPVDDGVLVTSKAKEALEGGVGKIRQRLGDLRDVYFATSQQEERWEEASAVIQSGCRMYLTRRRYLRARAALQGWKLNYSKELLVMTSQHIERQKLIHQKMEQLRVMREMQLVQVVYEAWEGEMRAHQALRREIKEVAGKMEQEVNKRFKIKVLRLWRGVVIGPSSRRACRERFALRQDRARASLLAKAGGDGSGILTPMMVQQEMKRQLWEEIQHQRRTNCLKKHFGGLVAGVQLTKENEALAERHHRCCTMAIAFYPWTEWTYTHSRGLDRKQWKGPRRYEVPYNRKRVDQFSRRRVLRLLFPLWRGITSRAAAAGRMQRRLLTSFLSAHMAAWQVVAKRCRHLRADVVERWKDRGRTLVSLPFQAWFLYVDRKRKEREDADRLIEQHRRLKVRQLLWKILRTWRHQAVFGRVEGLYSRTELMRSLAEQKMHSKALEQQSREFTVAIEESGRLLESSNATIDKLQKKLEGRESEVDNLKMAIHNAEQQVVQMQAALDSVAKMYPSVISHLAGLQDKFGFHERGLSGVARVRDGNERLESARVAAEAAQCWLETNQEAVAMVKGRLAAGGKEALSAADMALVESAKVHERTVTAFSDLQKELMGGDEEGEAQGDEAKASDANATGEELSGGQAGLPTPEEEEQSVIAIFPRMDEKEADALLRLQFCLKRMDLSAVMEKLKPAAADPNQPQDTEESRGGTVEELNEELLLSCGLWQFLRSGNMACLPVHLQRDWRRVDSEGAGGMAGREWNQLKAPAAVAPTGSLTWNDFVLEINEKMPSRKKAHSVRERMTRRIQSSKERFDRTMKGLYGPDKTAFAINPYSTQPVDDSFDPGTPREWAVDAPQSGLSQPASPTALSFGLR